MQILVGMKGRTLLAIGVQNLENESRLEAQDVYY